MGHRRTVLVLVALLALSGIVQIGSVGLAAQSEQHDVAGLWLDDTQVSDQRLQGANIIRRDMADLPKFRKEWIVLVDGTERPSGDCSYSLEVTEPADQATPKVFLMTAVDPATCRFEFTVGIPEKIERPDPTGFEFETSISNPNEMSAADVSDLTRFGYMHPSALGQFEGSTLEASMFQGGHPHPFPTLRYTVYAEWTDFLPGSGLVVNKVMSAAKAKAHFNNDDVAYRLSKPRCRNDRAWRVSSGWKNASSGKWRDKSCTGTNSSVKSSTNARFKNSDFFVCERTNPAWVYYDGVSARTYLAGGNSYFSATIVSTWTRGCDSDQRDWLRWAGFHTYPNEFWKALAHPL